MNITTMPTTRFWLALALGLFAGLADYLGGFLLVLRSPSARALRYFVALGAGFMLSAALLEMLPEAFKLNASASWTAALVLAGYCVVHLLEHTLVPHFHFGEETHAHEFLSARSSYSVALGLATHTFFDGVAIGSGFVVSAWLGWVLFIAIFPAQDSRRLHRGLRDAGRRTGTARGAQLRALPGRDDGAGRSGHQPAAGLGEGRAAAVGGRNRSTSPRPTWSRR